ncbi:MAG: hypothetical protein N838_21195 [Thiohalocapsa sp. PB-PSB1]|nr:MAG: hypothetical protein N838_21195 [Thiohalocapsa sp. PB-PSB1]
MHATVNPQHTSARFFGPPHQRITGRTALPRLAGGSRIKESNNTGRAVEAVVDAQVLQTLRDIDLVIHIKGADETSWKQAG